MKFRLIWIGSNADAQLGAAIERYRERIGRFFPIEIIEVAAEKDRQKKKDAAIIRADSARLIAAIPARGITVVVDERGESIDSLKFAKWLERISSQSPDGIHFVMGGDVGLDDAIRSRADRILSLSAMTLPHQIARLVLIEQIYRACTLMRNIRYHK
ncbi:MAG TPA: 23S rRNA (pseudouridine(1915)-N(3))-methyltransferase RlmH [Thermoanaerobaculia bacterium]|nr:23S rRNA (pseudouridine(1915)-N(3))-methyltransferase RlmH [Thermoanaerobaculia bacterium]